jgi:FKBP-type peptidyl-prolyl cis-trans isomerase
LRYIGRYLNGQVFDTNIADTAKKYGIYSQCNYELLSFKYFDNEDDALNQNSFVTGFSKALWRMTFDERCRTFFNSNFGYGNSGSGNIPGYTPLCFEIQVEKNPEKKDE